MGKLSHIDDVERKLDQTQDKTLEANSASRQPVASQSPQARQEEKPVSKPFAEKTKSTAASEAAFHGLEQSEGRSAGQTVLVAAAVVVVIAVIAYIANYSLHFI